LLYFTGTKVQIVTLLLLLLLQGDAADHSAWMHGGFREGFEGAGAARDVLHTETRDRLIHDIEEHCTDIWKPAEMSKMRAHKALVYAREALQFSGMRP
jgi:hypothetical protein